MIMEILFFASAGILLYSYFGYIIVLFIVSLIVHNNVQKKDITPMVTVLITAYNEEKYIIRKIENTLKSRYPRNRLEILVASDGSTDRTDELVKTFPAANVRLIRVEGRKGKTYVQNIAVKHARGKIIVFSDATTEYDENAIKHLVRNFNDKSVGCVTGRLRYREKEQSHVSIGTASYWEYEVIIKMLQSRIWSLTGATGCIYAVRKELYIDLPEDIISDLDEPLEVLAHGRRVVFEPEAVAYENTFEEEKDEMSMRIRVITRGMRGIVYMRHLFNPLLHPYYFIQIMSHKVIRWFFFELAAVLFVSNIFLVNKPLFAIVLLLQIVFYAAAVFAYIFNRVTHKDTKLLCYPLYFCLINMASVFSLYEIVRGKKQITWETNR